MLAAPLLRHRTQSRQSDARCFLALPRSPVPATRFENGAATLRRYRHMNPHVRGCGLFGGSGEFDCFLFLSSVRLSCEAGAKMEKLCIHLPDTSRVWCRWRHNFPSFPSRLEAELLALCGLCCPLLMVVNARVFDARMSRNNDSGSIVFQANSLRGSSGQRRFTTQASQSSRR